MYTPVFHHVPEDWRGRWRLIRTFVGRVFDVDFPDVGRVPRLSKELRASFQGKRLPPSVVEWMAFAEDLRKLPDAVATSFCQYTLRVTDFPEHASVALNRYLRSGVQWAVACRDFDQEDPPVSTYAFVRSRNQFELRKGFGRAPVTEFALLSVLNYSPYWFGGWAGYSEKLPTPLEDAGAFLEQVRRTKGARVSEPFGSVTFIEGNGWLAFVVNGYGIYGPDRFVNLRFTPGIRVWDIPRPVRDLVKIKPSHVRPS